jgi:septation ring formation regulator EzrA
MTAAQPDRLDRIEALVESNARAISAMGEHVDSIGDRLESSAQALSRDVAQLVSTQEQNSRELHQAMIRLADTQEGIARLLGSLDEDRPTILRKLNTIEGKVDSLLDHQNQPQAKSTAHYLIRPLGSSFPLR